MDENAIGGQWLAQTFDITTASRPAVTSRIGGRRATNNLDGFLVETYQEAMRPTNTLAGHLLFHIRHEIPHLEMLARLFQQEVAFDAISQWNQSEPTGAYARRAGFLYEWITGRRLPAPDTTVGNYVDAVDGDRVFAAAPSFLEKNRRWRVNDNMPGTRFFCPLISRDSRGYVDAVGLDVPALLSDLTTEFGEETLLKSAVWLTLRESKSSFTIEGEEKELSKIQRFAHVMGTMTGVGEIALQQDVLAELQEAILGRRSTLQNFGLRLSPVFVGESYRGREIIHYVAPPCDEIEAMLSGIATFLNRTTGMSTVIRSTIASFGFVYIHPLADGNGRVHRFLVNDILRRDGAIPDPVILPISATISDDHSERRAYDMVLDQVSRPLMSLIRDDITFSEDVEYPDGIRSNLRMRSDEKALPVWRYPDLAPHLGFMARVIRTTLVDKMHQEAAYLRGHLASRVAIKDIIEMPDSYADRIIRSIETNNGKLTNSLRKEIPALAGEGTWEQLVEAVAHAKAKFDDHGAKGTEYMSFKP